MPNLPFVNHSSYDRNDTTFTLTATPPSDTGLVAFLFFSGIRATDTNLTYTITAATCKRGGTTANLTHLKTETETSTNRYAMQALYYLDDPIGTLGSGEHIFTITTSRNVIAGAINVIYVSGVTSIGTPAGKSLSNYSFTLDYTNTGTPSIILAGGHVQLDSSILLAALDPTDDITSIVEFATGNNSQLDLAAFVGYIDRNSIGTSTIGWEWGASWAAYAVVAVEVIGHYEEAPLALTAEPPTVILGDILIEDLIAPLAMGNGTGEIGLGSIPPVQVIGLGNMYFTTSAQNLTAILLATAGTDWVIVDSGGSTEQLGCAITRRKGYITPR